MYCVIYTYSLFPDIFQYRVFRYIILQGGFFKAKSGSFIAGFGVYIFPDPELDKIMAPGPQNQFRKLTHQNVFYNPCPIVKMVTW